MIPFRFLHAADLHLDSPFQGLSAIAPVLRESLQNATFQAFERLVDLCLTRKVDALLIAGDLHNAVDRSLRALTRMRDQFHRLQANGIAVFLCHGNHDPLCGWEARFTWPDNVHVFGTAEVAARPLLKNGAEAARVLGISYGRERVEENLALQFTREKDAPWSIALLHTNVGHDRNHANYAPCKLSDLLQSGMDYWALGHIHTHRVLHSGNPVVLYPGNPQGRHPREPGPRGCYIVDVDARGTGFPRLRPDPCSKMGPKRPGSWVSAMAGNGSRKILPSNSHVRRMRRGLSPSYIRMLGMIETMPTMPLASSPTFCSPVWITGPWAIFILIGFFIPAIPSCSIQETRRAATLGNPVREDATSWMLMLEVPRSTNLSPWMWCGGIMSISPSTGCRIWGHSSPNWKPTLSVFAVTPTSVDPLCAGHCMGEVLYTENCRSRGGWTMSWPRHVNGPGMD